MKDPADIDQAILQIVSELATVRRSEIRPQDRLREDLGLDSVSAMELLSMLAERLELDVSIEEAMEVTTVAEVVAIGRRHLEARVP